ncbi:MAG: hypothetical protein ABL962_16365, partial [Fimbriimonadaceae bacterium]
MRLAARIGSRSAMRPEYFQGLNTVHACSAGRDARLYVRQDARRYTGSASAFLLFFFRPQATVQHTFMAKKHHYKFCFGPWNISEGQDPYGPTTRPAQTFDWKLAQLKKHGYDAMMFHDDDAVPDIDSKSDAQVRKESRELKKKLDDAGVAAEMTAPRLWFDPRT